MANSYFQFKQFTVRQDRCAMKVTTDACLFGAWVAGKVVNRVRKDSPGKSLVFSHEPAVVRLLDIGTGTGLLSLMLVQKNNRVLIDSVEIDKDAAEQAKENIANSPWTDRINVIKADIKKHGFSKQYDIIVSNPPFYANELKSGNKLRNIAHHNEGLLLPELLTIIKNNLRQEGAFYLLLPYKRHDEIRRLITEQELALNSLVLVRPSTGHDFFRILLEGTLKSPEEAEPSIYEISVKDQHDQYSPEFVDLLEEYYLHL